MYFSAGFLIETMWIWTHPPGSSLSGRVMWVRLMDNIFDSDISTTISGFYCEAAGVLYGWEQLEPSHLVHMVF